MPHQSGKKSYTPPEMIHFQGPLVEERIRQWARDHGFQPEEIEDFLEEVRKAKLEKTNKTSGAFG